MYDESGACVHHLNGPAAIVWQVCLEGATAQQMVTRIRRAYDADEDRAQQDVERVVKQLGDEGAIR
ncbi:MAG TPA: PqqD family protein [Candidatus Latescibacteria bacterium]|nr:PqqD family protein [Candidatus Latescibacterota bacterium]MDP7632193.1 PqqD family protein [Candidatus Latescibacterota bacterium]HJN27940.1 PqqD family protein [Candidatus Latescibacterota bacterium]